MPEEPNLSRRDLFRGRLFGRAANIAAETLTGGLKAFADAVKPATANPAMQPVRPGTVGRRFSLPIHRPPGAVDEVSFLKGCTPLR